MDSGHDGAASCVTMLGMDPDAVAELRSLQARAYGPASDIHDDPDALRRLEELQARAASIDATAPAADPVAAVEEEPQETPPSIDPIVETAEVGPAEASIQTHRFRNWTPWVWLGSLIGVAAVAVLWTFFTMVVVLTPIDRGPGTDRIALLEVDPDFATPGFFGDPEFEATGFRDFYGVTLLASDGSWFGVSSEESCLWLIRTEDVKPGSDSLNGPIFNDCSAGAFPATIEVVLTPEMPQEIRDKFAEGTALQFILDGDRVGVFADAEVETE